MVEVLLSQLPNFHNISWLAVAATMSFTYSVIALSLGIAKVAENGTLKGSPMGMALGGLPEMKNIWRTCQAIGDLAFAFSYAIVVIKIQDTLQSPHEEKYMNRATKLSIGTTTLFYMLCGGFAYTAFGDKAPDNLLMGYESYGLEIIANIVVVIHLAGAYQVFSQTIFNFVEKETRWPNLKQEFSISYFPSYKCNIFRLIWRSVFVILTSLISHLIPFFSGIVGLIGALWFWPLSIYFPVEMWISQKEIQKWSPRWIWPKIFSICCFIVSIAAAIGSVAGLMQDSKALLKG